MDTAFVGAKGVHYVMARLVDLLTDRVKAIPAAPSVQDLDQRFPDLSVTTACFAIPRTSS